MLRSVGHILYCMVLLILGPDPEMLDGENFNSRKSSNEGPPLPKSSDIKFNSLPNGHAVTESNEMTQDSASCESWIVLVL